MLFIPTNAMKTKRDIQRIGAFNCQGLLAFSKQWTLADNFMRYNMAVLCIQEIQMQGCDVLSIKSNYRKNTLFSDSGHQTNSINGVAISHISLRISNDSIN